MPEKQVRAEVAEAFARHRGRVRDALADLGDVSIEHVGSTSVPGALTKGDLDLLVRVTVLAEAVDALTRAGYHVRQQENWTPCFASFAVPDEENPEVGVQVVLRGERTDRSMRSFPSLLRERADLLDRYNALKCAFDGADQREYRAAKAAFIHSVLPSSDEALLPPTPPMTLDVGAGMSLRLMNVGDADDLAGAVRDGGAELTRFLPHLEPLRAMEAAEQHIRGRLQAYAMGASAEWCIGHEGRVVGAAWLTDIQPINRAADIGYWLTPSVQGRGLATRCAAAIVACAFDVLDLNRLSIRCITDNAPSRAIPVRLGFREEAVIEEAWMVHGQLVDHVIYRMLASERP